MVQSTASTTSMDELSISDLKISRLKVADIPAIYKMSREARWPHTKQDWLDTLRFGQAVGHRAGKTVVSCISITEYTPQFAALSMVLVQQKFHGKGLASALLKDVQRRNPSTRSLGVIASSKKATKIYESYGFRDTGEQIISYLHPAGMDNRIWKHHDPYLVVNTAPITGMIDDIPVSKKNVGVTLEVDAKMTEISRKEFLRSRILTSNSAYGLLQNWKIVDDWQMREKGQKRIKRLDRRTDTWEASNLLGYAIGNFQEDSLMNVGPLVANNPHCAFRLILQLMKESKDHPTMIRLYDVWERRKLRKRLKMIGFFEVAKQPIMIHGPLEKVPGPRKHLFCPASLSWVL